MIFCCNQREFPFLPFNLFHAIVIVVQLCPVYTLVTGSTRGNKMKIENFFLYIHVFYCVTKQNDVERKERMKSNSNEFLL